MPKTGTSDSSNLADRRHGVFAGRGRIAGTVGEKYAVGFERQDILGRRIVAGTTVTLAPRPASSRRMLRFTP